MSDADDITETEILVDVTLRTVTISLAKPLAKHVSVGTLLDLHGETIWVQEISEDRMEILAGAWVNS